ncbi:MAG TPA: hypothetical protein VLB51_05255 [Methylomirabilota bacterium]|nr:hypothetical protein [Methylomirabilota bacterium]
MRAILTVAAVLVVAWPAAGHPVLDEGRRTGGGWCFPDHRERGVWWLAPPAPRLADIDGEPAVDFTVYHYQGARATADDGQAWGGALLQFTLEAPAIGAEATAARRALGSVAELRPLPAAVVDAEVVFAGVNSARPATADDGPETPQAGAWQRRSFSLALTPEEVAAVHDAWRAGSVILSVNLAVSVYGFPTRPERDGDEPLLAPVVIDSVPITVDPEENPDLFRILELDATVPLAYTTIELGCAELAEGSGLADLVRVIATVEAEAVNGDLISLELRFTPTTPQVQAIRFDRAVRVEHGYELRIVRVYSSGRTETGPPRRLEVWQGFADICSSADGRSDSLDPRLLY